MINLQEILKGIKPYVLGWIAGLLGDLKDYSDLSTIVGWSSFTYKNILYCKVGKRVFVKFHLAGSSNSTSATFTLPSASDANIWSIPVVAIDAGYVVTETPMAYFTNEAVCHLYVTIAGAGWTASGTKDIRGQFWYQTAS